MDYVLKVRLKREPRTQLREIRELKRRLGTSSHARFHLQALVMLYGARRGDRKSELVVRAAHDGRNEGESTACICADLLDSRIAKTELRERSTTPDHRHSRTRAYDPRSRRRRCCRDARPPIPMPSYRRDPRTARCSTRRQRRSFPYTFARVRARSGSVDCATSFRSPVAGALRAP
jgi:hypothetical protein